MADSIRHYLGEYTTDEVTVTPAMLRRFADAVEESGLKLFAAGAGGELALDADIDIGDDYTDDENRAYRKARDRQDARKVLGLPADPDDDAIIEKRRSDLAEVNTQVHAAGVIARATFLALITEK